jgi:hypothetical protein
MIGALQTVLQDQPGERRERVQLFVSHDHDDVALAGALVTAIEIAFEVPRGAIRCTSVPGYQLGFGDRAADMLRQDLRGAIVVLALLTPASLKSTWVMFELGAAWVLAANTIPLLAHGVSAADLPAALQGSVAGELAEPATGQRFLDQLAQLLAWTSGNRAAALNALAALGRSAASGSHPLTTALDDRVLGGSSA